MMLMKTALVYKPNLRTVAPAAWSLGSGSSHAIKRRLMRWISIEAKAARLRSNCAAEPRVEAALAKLRAVERTFHPDKARGATFTATEVSAVLHDLRDLLRGA